MKIVVKKQGETVLELDDVVSIVDKYQAYEVEYKDGTSQLFFKVADKVEITITD